MPDPRIAILTNVELRRLGKYLNTSLEAKGAKKEKTDDYSGHYVIASSRPPKRRPLERPTLVPKADTFREGLKRMLRNANTTRTA